MLVVDATVVLAACATDDGFAAVRRPRPGGAAADVVRGPRACCTRWRAAGSSPPPRRAGCGAPSTGRRSPSRATRSLGEASWDIADRMGLARTYAAEYVALARLLGCRLVTLDADIARRARRLAVVVGPADL